MAAKKRGHWKEFFFFWYSAFSQLVPSDTFPLSYSKRHIVLDSLYSMIEMLR